MSAGFTPGPWSVSNPTHVIRRQYRDERNRRCTDWIAECCNQVGREREESEANARLIAAAPELYAKVELAATIFEEYARLHALKLQGAQPVHAVPEIQAKAKRNEQYAAEMRGALAKARGDL